ncbi:DUF692 domain-containing protein [Labilithrix luteola]|uniref:MNIO family bufferin maturase n=1 Tax=Labilithrix luteola TaxID=1391654 RepID=UPI000AF37C48|nr:DUF692 domain-containing protein [Labilithrix luteola]
MRPSSIPYLGHGVGLRPVHYAQVLEEHPPVDWFEVISENFMVAGGNPRRVLRKVRERYPVVLHGVGLSLGSVDPLDEGYLSALEELAADVEPAWLSDHLCWSSFGGHRAHDLWPLPYTEEALDLVAARMTVVQERLGRRFLVENVSSYLRYTHSTLSEWEFLTELSKRTDCFLLLDVNNVHVSAHNHGFDPLDFIRGVPADRVAQIHLAGHSDEGTHFLDSHDRPVCQDVWSLYEAAIARFGRVSTLIEWDDCIPPLERLIDESIHAATIERAMVGGAGAEAAHEVARAS